MDKLLRAACDRSPFGGYLHAGLEFGEGVCMKFWEAMKELQKGQKVRCEIWRKSGYMDLKSAETEFKDISYMEAFHNEWELYEEKYEKTYSFAEVVKGLKEGKSYIRHGWSIADAMSANLKYPESFIGNGVEACAFSLVDFEATDWICVSEPTT